MLKLQESCKAIVPSTHTPEVYVQVWDRLISRNWYESHRVEMSFSLIGDALAGLRISPVPVDGNIIPPATQPREKLWFLSYPYPSASNPVHATVNVSFQNPSASYYLLCHRLGSGRHHFSPGLSQQPGWLSCLCSYLPPASTQHGSQCDPGKVSALVFLWSEPSSGSPSHSEINLLQTCSLQGPVFSDPPSII